MSENPSDKKNPYFNFYNGLASNEAELFRGFNDEMIHIYGLPCKYLPRSSSGLDPIFGENPSAGFSDAYDIVLLPMNMAGWENETYLYSKFGLTNDTTQGFLVEVNRFRKSLKNTIQNPREGDLIFVETFNKIFEITFQDNDDEIYYHNGQLYIFSIYTKNFRYSHETISTGDAAVDNAVPVPGESTNIVKDNTVVADYDLKKQISEELDEIEDDTEDS